MLGNKPNKLIQVVKTMQSVMGEIPLTLKMRYGLHIGDRTSHNVMKKVVDACPPQMLILHPRSKDQRYTKLAEWDYVPTCLDSVGGKVPFWVCGDIFNYENYYNVSQLFFCN
jgi:tRNA-dihydrouridine synthase 3